MRSRTPIRRWATRGSAAAFTAVALTAGMQAALAGGAQASPHQAANRVVNPYSKSDWEATGIQPDIKVPAASALRTALRRAQSQLRTK